MNPIFTFSNTRTAAEPGRKYDPLDWSAVAMVLLCAMFFGLLAYAFWAADRMNAKSESGARVTVHRRV